MTCPFCAVEDNNKVVDSRSETMFVYRRRICLSCDGRWTTYEVPVDVLRPLAVLGTSIAKVIRLKPLDHSKNFKGSR